MKIEDELSLIAKQLNCATWLNAQPKARANTRNGPRRTFCPRDHLPQRQAA